MQIAMTLLAGEYPELLAENLLFHHAMGVDRFVIMEPRPADATREVLADLQREMDIRILNPIGQDRSQWKADMTRTAGEDGADWILEGAVDAFWVPRNRDLRTLLSGRPPRNGTVSGRHYRAVIACDGGDPLGGTAHPRSARAFEPLGAGDAILSNRTGLRHGRSEANLLMALDISESEPGEQVAMHEDIRFLHYPCRSLEQYMAEHPATPEQATSRFRSELAQTREEICIGLTSGALVNEDSVAGFLENKARQDRQAALHVASAKLIEQTRSQAQDFAQHHANLILAAPREDRKNRPLYYNLRFAVSGPEAQLRWLQTLQSDTSPETLCAGFAGLRDGFSLFPQNTHFRTFLQDLLPLAFAEDVARLRADCAGKRVILHTSCWPRLKTSEDNIASFAPLEGSYHHVILIGEHTTRSEDETPLSFRYDGRILQVPTPDNYESLHRKLFYAYMLFNLLTEPELLVKIDDNILLEDADRFAACLDTVVEKGAACAGRKLGPANHADRGHGWHLGKCADPVLETRGYQYPLPRYYTAGGYGYVLGREGLAACSYMYLAMKAFFAIPAVGLEDACVGLAMDAQELALLDVADHKTLLALPGLITRERQRLHGVVNKTGTSPKISKRRRSGLTPIPGTSLKAYWPP